MLVFYEGMCLHRQFLFFDRRCLMPLSGIDHCSSGQRKGGLEQHLRAYLDMLRGDEFSFVVTDTVSAWNKDHRSRCSPADEKCIVEGAGDQFHVGNADPFARIIDYIENCRVELSRRQVEALFDVQLDPMALS